VRILFLTAAVVLAQTLLLLPRHALLIGPASNTASHNLTIHYVVVSPSEYHPFICLGIRSESHCLIKIVLHLLYNVMCGK